MSNNYLVIDAKEYETEETIKYRIISSTTFKRAWSLLGGTLGFQIAPGSQVPDLHVSKSGNNYIIHHLPKLSSSNAKIIISDTKFEFLAGTILTGEAKSTQLTPSNTTSINLSNRSNATTKFVRKLATLSSSTTTVSSSHKIAAGFSIKQSYSAGASSFFSASLGISFDFSYEYSFGNQEKVKESTESIDEVSINIPPMTNIPLTLTYYKTKLSVPFTALAQMFYNITFEGPFNRSGSAHTVLGTPPSSYPLMMNFSYKFGTNSKSAEDAFKEEDSKNFIKGVTPWNWSYIDSTSRRLDLNFKAAIKNGFATRINGKFEKDDSKVTNIQLGIK